MKTQPATLTETGLKQTHLQAASVLEALSICHAVAAVVLRVSVFMDTDRASDTWSLDILQTEHSGKYRSPSASGVEGAASRRLSVRAFKKTSPPRCCSMVGRTGTSSSDDLVQRRLPLVADSFWSEALSDTEGAVLSACPACVHGLWRSVRRKAWQQRRQLL